MALSAGMTWTIRDSCAVRRQRHGRSLEGARSTLGRIVAIKVSDVEFDERFKSAARAVTALNHPYICQLYEVGPNYLTMEYIEGKQLAGPLPLDQTLEYAIQVAEALQAAHEKRIIHGNLTLANIRVTKSGVKVIDFGLARETQTTDTRSDIFAFGEVLSAIKSREPTSTASFAPAALDHLIRRCLAKDPNDRWQTARDLVLELRWIREGAAQTGTTSNQPNRKLADVSRGPAWPFAARRR